MGEQPDREFRRKAHFDLWIHQNDLFWGRFQLLYVMQGAFFLVTAALKGQPIFVGAALLTTLVLMGWLYSTVDQDRLLRNYHATILRGEFGFDPLPPKLATVPGLSQNALETIFQLFIFVPFAIIDLVASLYWITH